MRFSVYHTLTRTFLNGPDHWYSFIFTAIYSTKPHYHLNEKLRVKHIKSGKCIARILRHLPHWLYSSINFDKPIMIFNTPIFPRYSTDSHNHLSDVKKKGRMHWKEHNMTSGQSLIDNLRHQSCHNKRNNWNLSIHVLSQSWLDISSSN